MTRCMAGGLENTHRSALGSKGALVPNMLIASSGTRTDSYNSFQVQILLPVVQLTVP